MFGRTDVVQIRRVLSMPWCIAARYHIHGRYAVRSSTALIILLINNTAYFST